MSKKKIGYNILNIFVILITVGLFVYEYRDVTGIFEGGAQPVTLVILVVAVILVHIMKAGRLYLALYGLDISILDYIKAYCKVTPVSMVIPFKIGDFFRMYCYGNLIGNEMRGVVIILLDRVMDTMALISLILFFRLIWRVQIFPFVYFFLTFLAFALIVYHCYPRIYEFWKKYLLKATATEQRLQLLKVIKYLNDIYEEVKNVVRGRGIILYCISCIAWIIEIGSLYVLNKLMQVSNMERIIADYLTSAISENQSMELKRFVIVSVVLLIGLYGVIKAKFFFIKGRDENENNSCI